MELRYLLTPIIAASQINSILMAAFSNPKVDSFKVFQNILLTLPVSVKLQAVFDELSDFLLVFYSKQRSIRKFFKLAPFQLCDTVAHQLYLDITLDELSSL